MENVFGTLSMDFIAFCPLCGKLLHGNKTSIEKYHKHPSQGISELGDYIRGVFSSILVCRKDG